MSKVVTQETCSFYVIRSDRDCPNRVTWKMTHPRRKRDRMVNSRICGVHRREMLSIGIPESSFTKIAN